MAKQKDSLILYYGLYEDLKNLTKSEGYDVIMAAFEYDMYGTVPQLRSRSAKIVFRNVAKGLDVNKQRYEEVCERNRNNISKRWNSKKITDVPREEYEPVRSHTAVYDGSFSDTKNTDTDTVYVTEKETVNDTCSDTVYVYDNDENIPSEGNTHTQKKQYGLFSNVFLADEEFEQLKKLCPTDYQQRIDSMSSYMKAQGKSYKDDFARLCSWKLLDKKEEQPKKIKDDTPSYDIDAYMQQSLNLEYVKN